ncbi:hypothetical protein F511_24537 [Dorcoceras hygrometricum]|uniref:PB1 domain-containing protein n=1 Tax=Dorcoceras hygrometricum TaxID=472368 RepID=A0A2Z7BG52_9LAMI|nr:hypothetical protein F511_24537 [Dorcoceras hygrometricum]
METISGYGSSNFTFLGSYEYKDELYKISICIGFSLMELFLTLWRKCEEISPQNVIMQYLAPHRKLYVTLNEDDDVRNMTHLHTCMRLTIIDMRAVKKDQMGARNVNRAESEDETQTSNDGHLQVSLVSNSTDMWSNCIRGEGQTISSYWRHKADNLFGIRRCNLIHTCGDDNLRSRGHPRTDASWVANIVKDRLRGEPSYRPCMMLTDIQ